LVERPVKVTACLRYILLGEFDVLKETFELIKFILIDKIYHGLDNIGGRSLLHKIPLMLNTAS
jgi:hypothetical protein